MGYFTMDRMRGDDVPEVMAIERASFSHPWPSSAYRRELHENRLARYQVLRCPPEVTRQAAGEQPVTRRGFPATLLRLTERLLGNDVPTPPSHVTMAGYAGLWLSIDEAHVTTIAVRPQFRGRGFGELLLVSLADVALEINARWLTLEVRVTNEVAQTLYRKYGFKPTGVRPKYYSDNGEDALIMWTDELRSSEYRELFNRNKEQLLTSLRLRGDLPP